MSNLKLFESPFDDSFEQAFRRFLRPTWSGGNLPEAPPMRLDIEDKDSVFVAKVEIPGVKKDDIGVRIDGSVVTIEADVKRESEATEDQGRVVRSERYFGHSSRSIDLGHDLDATKAQAQYSDGILTLVLPKSDRTGATRVTIR